MGKISTIATAVRLTANKAAFFCNAHSPELIGIGATVAIVTGLVVAIKQTPKAIDALEERRKVMEDIERVHDDKEGFPDYTDKDYKHDKFITNIKYGAKLAGIYAVPVGLTVAGIAGFWKGMDILKCRWLESVELCNALNSTLHAYRGRVRDEVGEEKEKDIFYNVQTKDILKTNENGELEKVSDKVIEEEKIGHMGSLYAVIFDEYNPNWNADPALVADMLECMRQEIIRRGIRTGHLFLADVYEMLDFKFEPIRGIHGGLTPEQAERSRNVGWIFDGRRNPNDIIDFGPMYKVWKQHADYKADACVILDFKPDGDIRARLYHRPDNVDADGCVA